MRRVPLYARARRHAQSYYGGIGAWSGKKEPGREPPPPGTGAVAPTKTTPNQRGAAETLYQNQEPGARAAFHFCVQLPSVHVAVAVAVGAFVAAAALAAISAVCAAACAASFAVSLLLLAVISEACA